MPAELAGWNIYREEGFKEKFLRKTKENPFVPVGLMATAAVLSFGLVQFRRGDRHKSQRMMRMRIAAQGFTVVAIIIGVAVNARQSVMSKK
ncbi:HIG1 domain family member 2A-like [Glandiceps talaboti]